MSRENANKEETLGEFMQRITKRKKMTFNVLDHPICSSYEVIEIVGPHLSGGTSVLLHLAASHLLSSSFSKVFYLDCDRGVDVLFLPRLLQTMSPSCHVKLLLDRFLLARCNSLQEFSTCISDVLHECSTSSAHGLLLVDNISAFHWLVPYKAFTKDLVTQLRNLNKVVTVVLFKHPPTKAKQDPIPQYDKILSERYYLSGYLNPRILMAASDSNRHVKFNIDECGAVVPC